jgi:short-subunit dehydrogenase
MNIIINGGTRGIGREVALLMAQNKNNLILVTGRNSEALNTLSSNHKNIKTLIVDLSDFDKQINEFRHNLSEVFNEVNILINLAGYLTSKDFLKTENFEARKIMETNFFGPASLIRVVQPFMKSGSHIVNISSMGGFQGSSKYRGLSYYSASKAALACLTECLALEFAEFGISVNCLALGAVQTEMLDEAFPGYKAPVNAKEMAEYICDFASNGHKFMNGKILPVAMSNP